MQDFSGKLAVITGGGTGMGRELARALIAEGCDVAICDVIDDNMNETVALCEQEAAQGRRITAFRCDVSNPDDVEAFRQHVATTFESDSINLLFNNAGIAGAGSFLVDAREDWERTWRVCWDGVYLMSRAFMPMLVASDEGHIVNTSSVNGFWATMGPEMSHTAYSAAKFAVRGFTEALVTDLRLNAPHVKASVVMPGHIGTSIVINSNRIHGDGNPETMSDAELEAARSRLLVMGADVQAMSADELREAVLANGASFRDIAPTSAAEAAQIMLQGVRDERWRVLVGEDAAVLDEHVRATPEEAYEPEFLVRLAEAGWGVEPAPDA